MPLSVDEGDFKQLVDALIGWQRTLTDGSDGAVISEQLQPAQLQEQCETLQQSVRCFPSVTVPVSCVSVALSNCSNQQSVSTFDHVACMCRNLATDN